ncbi:MAG: flagellar brake protein [Gammaproteobacteria bacterium]|nr:flagellar brake protein [Gammaproteobacteria bacterium]
MNESNDLINLPAGTILQIQATVPEKAPRYSVRLIGSLPGSSLVITTPTVDGKVQIVREGQRFTVRVLKGERVLGFVAQVLYASMKPYPHLHLEYPDEFEQIVVRNASRVNVQVDAVARNTAQSSDADSFRPAMVVDLSETGAKLSSTETFGQVGEMLHIKFQLAISGQTEDLGLVGIIRNITERDEDGALGGGHIYLTGVQFQSLSRFQQVLLHAWVTNRVLQNTLQTRRR